MYKRLMRVSAGVACLWLGVVSVAGAGDGAVPKTIAYSGVPTAYFDEHAAEVATLYDGFFSINVKSRWGVNLRFGDEDGFPLEGVTFSVPISS